VTADSWASLAQLVTKQSSEPTEKHFPKLHFTLGLHPVFLNEHKPEHLTKLDELLHTEPVIAVGEIGLDFFIKELDQTKQTELFSEQLTLAKKHDLPVILHVALFTPLTVQFNRQITILIWALNLASVVCSPMSDLVV